MFLKKSTTFTFTNIRMCCYIIQIDVTAVILFHVRKHFPETFQMHCALRFCMRSFSVFPVQIIPDPKDFLLDLHLIIFRLFIHKFLDLNHPPQNVLMPLYIFFQLKRCKTAVINQWLHIFTVKNTSLISVN